jgi:microcystin-dependent protein
MTTYLSETVNYRGGCPTGTITYEPSTTVPERALACNGASLAKLDYPELYAAIGDTFGNADADHFYIPDARGRFLEGGLLTSNVGDYREAKIESHVHNHNQSCGGSGYCGNYGSSNPTVGNSDAKEVTTSADNAPVNISVQMVIWYKGREAT